jgi:hypothetical protein
MCRLTKCSLWDGDRLLSEHNPKDPCRSSQIIASKKMSQLQNTAGGGESNLDAKREKKRGREIYWL